MSNSIMMNGNNSVCNLTMFSNHRLTLFEARDTSIKPTPVWHLPGMMKSLQRPSGSLCEPTRCGTWGTFRGHGGHGSMMLDNGRCMDNCNPSGSLHSQSGDPIIVICECYGAPVQAL